MENKRVVSLVGKKVILRPPNVETDVELFYRWINDPEVRCFLAVVLPVTIMEERKWVEGIGKNDENIIFVIETKEDGIPIGTMGLHRINWVFRTATTGALIGEKEYWGKGFGTDAKMTLLDYAFNTLNLRKICSSAFSYNGRSIGHNLKCGYQLEGVRKRQFFRKGRYWDQVLLAVFKRDWLPLWKKYNGK
ncbi:MAG: GNAT family protein [Candidatus Paceibacterota bacterium]